jgi:flagellar basal body-associated protein FliL
VSNTYSKHKSETAYETEAASPLQRRRPSMVVLICVCFVLAWVAGGTAFLWFGYDSAPRPATKVSLEDFEQYRHEVTGSLQRDREMLQAQDAEIKRLSDQLSQVITKMDSLGSRVREAQAAVSPTSPKAAPQRPTAKPAPPISTAAPEENNKR